MLPLKTFAPEAFEIEMLCGAPSWLSKTMSKAVSALTETAVGTNLMSLAVIVTASPLGLPAGAAGVGAPADAPEQAASTAASASRPKVRVRRFMSVGSSCRCGGLGAGRGGAAATDQAGEGCDLSADHRDRAAVVTGEVDGQCDDQRDFDGLGDVGGGEVRAHDRPGDDRGRSVAHQADADAPAEPDSQGERDDHRDCGDG